MFILGPIYKQLRKARHISLKEAAGSQFSISMLSRFENGLTELSADKLYICLENIYVTPQEFMDIVNEYNQPSYYKSFFDKLNYISDSKFMAEMSEKEAKEYIQNFINDELQQSKIDNAIQFHTINQILIKYAAKAYLDFKEFEPSEEEVKYIHDYLFLNDLWCDYEINIFRKIASSLETSVYLNYIKEILNKPKLFQKYHEKMITIILIEALFYFVFAKENQACQYVVDILEKRMHGYRDIYLIIMYWMAKSYYLCTKKDPNYESLFTKSINLLQDFGFQDSIDYYKQGLDRILNQ